jgi:alkane 1-monooxygenase
MSRPMLLFAFVTLIPVPLIAGAALWGGPVVLVAVLYLTLFTATLDEAVSRVTPPAPDSEFPVATVLSVTLALAHFVLLLLVVRGLSGDVLILPEKAGLFVAAGLFMGQVSNSNAHELIHRGGRGLHRLGMWVYISLLFGHHASAHPLVHHVLVATRADPSSARAGEGFYRFAWRAWKGSFRAGFRVETERLERAGRARWQHPYLVYLGGALGFCLVAVGIGGAGGLGAFLALAGFAQSQLLLSDYVQHYGLTRRMMANGKPEPVSNRHSWNSPHVLSSALMLNAPRHSDHHARPARPYPALTLLDAVPMLPRSLPVMACVALYPPFWRRVMDPLARAWRDAAPGDQRP